MTRAEEKVNVRKNATESNNAKLWSLVQRRQPKSLEFRILLLADRSIGIADVDASVDFVELEQLQDCVVSRCSIPCKRHMVNERFVVVDLHAIL